MYLQINSNNITVLLILVGSQKNNILKFDISAFNKTRRIFFSFLFYVISKIQIRNLVFYIKTD